MDNRNKPFRGDVAKQSPRAQKPTKRGRALALSTVSFPIYVVKSLGQRHLIIGGGGGSAKTGILNKIVIYEIKATNDACELLQIQEFDSESDAIMTGDLMNLPIHNIKFAAAGSPTNMMRIYSIKFSPPESFVIEKEFEEFTQETLQEEGGYKRLVNLPKNNILVGGAMDGKITVWPDKDNLRKFSQFQAYDQEIDEMDGHPDGIHVAALSRAKDCTIWDIFKGERLQDIRRDKVNTDGSSISYHFRSCKYGEVKQDGKSIVHLYTVSNPPNGIKSALCRLTKWDTQGYEIVKQVFVGNDQIMALAVSKDGQFIGLGTGGGAVYIHNSSNLKQIYSIKKAHTIFVTSLEFLPPSVESKLLTNTRTLSLISVSCDKRIVLHRPSQTNYMYWIMMMLSFTFIFLLVYYFPLIWEMYNENASN